MESLKLVIVEDEEAHFLLMKRAISKELPSALVLHFENARAFLERLDDVQPDVIIADYLTPGMDALQLLKALNGKRRNIPVIIVTGQGDERIAVQAMKLGAWDYLVKSADFFSLLPSVIGKVISTRKLQESLDDSARLNELLLDSLPHPAMIIRQDRVVLAANRVAREAGAKNGGYCWRDFGQGNFISDVHKRYISEHAGAMPPDGAKCTFCLADEALAQKRPTNDPEVEAFGRIWDTWWIPIEGDLYFHYALDITERKRTEQANQVSYRLLEAANHCSEMSPLLETFISELRKFTRCRAIGIRILDESGNIPYEAHEGFGDFSSAIESPLSIQSDHCMCVDVVNGATNSQLPYFTKGGSFYINSSTRFLATLREKKKQEARHVWNEYGLESVALVPIRLGQRIIGLIHLADPAENKCPLELVEMVQKIAMELGAAIHRVRSDESLRNSEKQLRFLSTKLLSAHEEERRRIAREIHDSLGATLSAVKISLLNVQREVENGTVCAESMEIPSAWIQHAMDEARRIIADLRPSILDDYGIARTLGWFFDQFQSMYPGIAISPEIGIREEDISDSLKTAIFRVIQEALNNAAKHSGADRIKISLVQSKDSIKLLIEDNGSGFDLGVALPNDADRGLGLTSMRERVELSRGIFSIQSRLGEGTTIRAVWDQAKTSQETGCAPPL